ncbi:acetyl-CoA C-acyltransferase [Actinomadura bangladeshensis]|uniref:Acetyl-CoA C-acyltransferase n=1 Tax=Actinomadura bangladeshensis TaxID=453573 RepID=A0A4R4PEV1_9ACTN|nr:acetyl-CoA C-acyltransferase [Actinomadura bangladeshensis]TDC20377.1 acetyl-CoA C-acyltransferase [Actinomadura bangladeshensis]
MPSVVVVDAVRSPVGKRNGGLATMHAADLFGQVLAEVVARSGIDPDVVEQVIGGCVSQVGMQGFNVTRTAALVGGLSLSTGATTVDAQCGSAQQAFALAAGLVAAGTVDVAIAGGVEVMSAVPMGSSLGKGLGKGIPKSYFDKLTFTTQFQGAELIARKWGLTRDDLDAFGLRSQQRAAEAWAQGRFDGQILPVDAPDIGEDGKPTGTTHRVERDECLRETDREALAGLRPVVGPDDRVIGPEPGLHTAGTSSQISDGASAVLLMSEAAAQKLGVTPRARVVDSCLVGSDPVLMLTGPIDATHRLLGRTGLSMDDIGVVEINEAFASVVLAWQRKVKAPDEIVNPNGGAIALGHPLGATGGVLVTKALDEMELRGSRYALVTMCCGGGLGTGTILAAP